MTIEVYYSPTQNSNTVFIQGHKVDWALEPDAKLILIISGKDWTDCMTKYHEEMGWEPYIPMENENTNKEKDN